MTIINHECYVSLEVAKLLKEAGFDWEVNHSYPNISALDNSCSGYMEDLSFYNNLNDGKYGGLSAPTLEVAQRWLRKIKNIEIYISWEIEFEEKELNWNKRRYCYDIDTHVNSIPLLSIDDDYWAEGYHTFGNSYSTYEEAQEEGIKKALEIILQK